MLCYLQITKKIQHSKDIVIAEIPLDILGPLTDIHTKENDHVTFECKVNKSGIKPRWLKDGRDIVSEGRFEILSKNNVFTLKISNVCLEDEGKYSCIIRNLRTDGKLFVEGIVRLSCTIVRL